MSAPVVCVNIYTGKTFSSIILASGEEAKVTLFGKKAKIVYNERPNRADGVDRPSISVIADG